MSAEPRRKPSVTSGRNTVWYRVVWFTCRRKVRVERPRLRRRGAGEGGEVEVPAYAAMRRPGAVADRMLEVLMAGVTRKYGRVIGEMADTVGVSKSAVSRETVEASERLKEHRPCVGPPGDLPGRSRWARRCGRLDSDGKKPCWAASENAEVTSALLEDLVERGLDPGRRRLFDDRWLESAQEGVGVRPTSPHPALPQPQSQRAGSSAEGSASSRRLLSSSSSATKPRTGSVVVGERVRRDHGGHQGVSAGLDV